jgi:hypothetical protein
MLEMWEDPSKFLNCEYVNAGIGDDAMNVTGYDMSFLAIHGINQYYTGTAKSGRNKGNVRPGVERPRDDDGTILDTNPSREIELESKQQSAIKSLVKKLNPIAEQYDFKVVGEVPSRKKEDVDIDFSNVLNEEITIKISEDEEITKSLGEWLSEATNPRYKVVKLQNGKKSHALHRDLYLNVLNMDRSGQQKGIPPTPIIDFIDQADATDAIYGAIFIHATRMLGRAVKQGLTSDLGDLPGHEGIVIRDKRITGVDRPVKITGEFLINNLGGGFGTVKEAESEIEVVEDEDADPVTDSEFTVTPTTIAVVPGAFKPPHLGHVDMVRRYLEGDGIMKADKVIVLISNPLKGQRTFGAKKKPVTAAASKKIWELLLGDEPNIEIQISPKASPIQAAYEYVGKDGPVEPGTTIILGASKKDDDWKRWMGAEQYIKDGLQLADIEKTAVEAAVRPDGKPYSASDFRDLLSACAMDGRSDELSKSLINFVGCSENLDIILDILGLETKEPMEEMSSASGGNVGGPGGPLFTSGEKKPGKRDRKKKRSMIRQENIDLSLVEEVLELIIGRGINYE